MSIGVYKITNIINSKIYVGSSAVSIENRWKSHLSDLRCNKHHSGRLQNAWNKYGKDSFVFEILEECPKEDVLKVEQRYIDELNPFYNICRVKNYLPRVKLVELVRNALI